MHMIGTYGPLTGKTRGKTSNELASNIEVSVGACLSTLILERLQPQEKRFDACREHVHFLLNSQLNPSAFSVSVELLRLRWS